MTKPRFIPSWLWPKTAPVAVQEERAFLPGPGGVGYIKGKANDFAQEYETLELAYTINPWVHRSIEVISSTLADVPLKVYRETGVGSDVEREEVFVGQHPLADLLWSPSPRMSGTDFVRRVAAFMALNGEAIIFVDNGSRSYDNPSGEPKRLQILKSRFVDEVLFNEVGVITGYVYQQMGGRKVYDPEFIVHPMNFNPFDDTRGLSPIKVAEKALTMQVYMMRHNSDFFKNGATPSGVLSAKGRLGDDAKKTNLEAWYKNYGANGKRARGIVHLDGDTTFQDIMATAKDGEFLGLYKLAMTEILADFGVPPFLVGDLDRANFANSAQQVTGFYQYTVKPLAGLIEDALNNQLVDVWYGKESGLYVEFDFSGITALQEDELRNAQIDAIAYNKWKTRNEIRLEYGLEADPDPESDTFPADPFANLGGGGLLSSDTPLVTRAQYARMSREEKWKSFATNLGKQEARYASTMRRYFTGQGERIAAAVEKTFDVGVLSSGHVVSVKAIDPSVLFAIFDLEAENEELVRIIKPVIKQIVNESGLSAATIAGDPKVWNVEDPRVANLIASKTLKVTQINGYTKRLLTRLLVDASSENATVTETARRIRDMFDDMTTARSTTIARTETVGANNGATIEGFAQSGIEQKEWLSSRDADVRDSHAEIDGEKQPIGQPFTNGLMYPGADGPPEEVINCRCTTLAVLD